VSTREQRIIRWVAAARDGERYLHEVEVYWGIFIVDGPDMRPIAMSNVEDAARMYADDLAADEDSNTEYDVSPCVLDIAHRDSFEVPS